MTHAILDSLRLDHQNVSSVMRIAAQELDAIADGREADYQLLEDAFRYLTGYSDVHHHPLEDLVYEELSGISDEAAAAVRPIVDQHEILIREGQSFLAAIEAIEESAIMRRDKFVAAGRAYLEALAEHMGIEERQLFPLAAAELTPAHWAAIDARFQRAPDPVFGPAADQDFVHLLRRIRD